MQFTFVIMADYKEREVLRDVLELYRESECLWDLSSSTYKDSKMKKTAWELLLEKYKEYDPNANDDTIKKKINNLKTSYQREAKKVKKRVNRTGSAASDIYRPNLWYFELMTFLDKKNESNRTEMDSIMSEEEDEPQIRETKKLKITGESVMDIKNEKILDTTQKLLRTATNSIYAPNPFGVYVGKKIEEISQGHQRDLAEKLISDILFLAKTNNLTFNTKIDIPSRTRNSSHHFNQYNPYITHSPSSTQISQSPHTLSNMFSNSPSYQYIPIHSPPCSSNTPPPPSQMSVSATSPNLRHSVTMESHSSSNSHQNSRSSPTHSSSYLLQLLSPPESASPVMENADLYAEDQVKIEKNC